MTFVITTVAAHRRRFRVSAADDLAEALALIEAWKRECRAWERLAKRWERAALAAEAKARK